MSESPYESPVIVSISKENHEVPKEILQKIRTLLSEIKHRADLTAEGELFPFYVKASSLQEHEVHALIGKFEKEYRIIELPFDRGGYALRIGFVYSLKLLYQFNEFYSAVYRPNLKIQKGS